MDDLKLQLKGNEHNTYTTHYSYKLLFRYSKI